MTLLPFLSHDVVSVVIPYFVDSCSDSFLDVYVLSVSFRPRDCDGLKAFGDGESLKGVPQISVLVELPPFLGSKVASCQDSSGFSNESFVVASNVDRSWLENGQDARRELSPGAGAVGAIESCPGGSALGVAFVV